MKSEELPHDSTDPAHVRQERLSPCGVCATADWREYFRLTSVYDRVRWMDRNVPSPRPAQSREELVAMPSQTHPTQE